MCPSKTRWERRRWSSKVWQGGFRLDAHARRMIDSSRARAAEPATVLSSRFEERTVSVRRRRNWLPYLMAGPILAYEVVFILYPIGQGVASSFTRTDVGRPVTFVGAANYQRMLTDPAFWTVVLHTLVYMLAVIGVSIG